jgi:hypothetical protein
MQEVSFAKSLLFGASAIIDDVASMLLLLPCTCTSAAATTVDSPLSVITATAACRL